MALPNGWHDNGQAVYGPIAPDGHTYFFSDASGMRVLALALFEAGVLQANDVVLENAAQVGPNRVEQSTQYHCLVISRADEKRAWSGFVSNLGAEHLKAMGRVPHALPLPTPAPVPSASPPSRVLASLARLGHGISEFIPGDYVHNGMCTQCSLEVCVAAKDEEEPLGSRMLGYTLDMIARGWANPNGGTSLVRIAQYASEVLHQAIAVQWNYTGDVLPHDWLGLLNQYAGGQPILVQVARGSALIDAETGVRDEAAARGLQYHAIAIVGKQGENLLACDGDHPQVTERFQVYSPATLAAALPCGVLLLA